MTAKINNELSKRMDEVRDIDPQKEIAVIITIKTGTNPADLEKRGLKIKHAYKNISAVSGTLPASAIDEIAQLDQVESIEYDGTVWAL